MRIIGAYRFDTSEGILRDAAGSPVALRSKSLKVLAKLSAQANQIVDREELIRSVWNGRAVSDDSLAQCIRDIRSALGDSDHRLVETCHRRGYRLNAGAVPEAGPVQRPTVAIERITTADKSDRARELALALHEQILITLAPRTGIRVVEGGPASAPADYSVGGRLGMDGAKASLFVRLGTPRDGQLVHVERFVLDPARGHGDVAETVNVICHFLLVYIIANHGQRFADIPNDELDIQPLLMKAAHFYGDLSEEGTRLAVDCLDLALSRAPGNAMALAMRANAATQMIPHVMAKRSRERVAAALELADRAVVLGPTIDFVYRTRGNLRLWLLGDHEGARADCRRSLELNPMFHLTHLTLGTSEILSGQYRQGADRIAGFAWHLRSERQYPYYLSLIALAHLLMENEDQAIRYASDAYERMPASDWHHLVFLAATANRGASAGKSYPRGDFPFQSPEAPSFEKLPFVRPEDADRLDARLPAR